MPSLAELRKGQSARVADVAGDDTLAARLMEMGFIPGEPVTFLGTAPLGDPLEFTVCGYRISLRRVEAARVEVETDEP